MPSLRHAHGRVKFFPDVCATSYLIFTGGSVLTVPNQTSADIWISFFEPNVFLAPNHHSHEAFSLDVILSDQSFINCRISRTLLLVRVCCESETKRIQREIKPVGDNNNICVQDDCQRPKTSKAATANELERWPTNQSIKTLSYSTLDDPFSIIAILAIIAMHSYEGR